MKLIIGPVVYEVVRTEQARFDSEHGNYIGRVIHQEGKIYVLDNMPVDQQQQTEIHEIVHVLAIQRNLDLTEKQIDALAYGFLEFVQDNPEYIKSFV